MKPETFIKTVAKTHGLTYKDIVGRKRDKFTTDIRQRIVIAFRKDWNMSYPVIGRYLNRDHTTIMYLETRSANVVQKIYTVPKDPLENV